jgi:hypothetical protein
MKIRVATILSLGAMLALAVPGVADAKSDKTPKLEACPAAWALVDGEGWWAQTLQGMIDAGVDPEDVADEFDMTVEEFKEFVIADVLAAVDKPGNDDGFVCSRPAPASYPSYFFMGMDNRMGPPTR